MSTSQTIGVYFGAHWCPPCRQFTPKLIDLYNSVELARPGSFEVVFVSSDSTEEEFLLNIETMPWLAVPFTEPWTNADGRVELTMMGEPLFLRDRLSSVFRVDGLPTLCILDASGDIVHIDAYEKVFQDPTGAGTSRFTASHGAASDCVS